MEVDAQQDGGPVVSAEAVSRWFDAPGRGMFSRRAAGPSVTALEEVFLSIDPSEFVAIVGTSGSGKSTLLHLLGALDTPTAGTVNLLGTDVSTLTERRRAQLRLNHVGVVFQRFHLLPALTACENVTLPLVELGVGKADRRARAAAMLERVGLGDRITHRPGELSGGEQQRVAIARALITDPDLLVADEPTGELDTESGAVVLDLLEDLAADRAVVVATHDPMVASAADRIVELRDGRVVNRG